MAPIQRNGNYYTFTDDIHDPIVVEIDNIVIDGMGYALRRPDAVPGHNTSGIILNGVCNVTIKNMRIAVFWVGIRLEGSSNNTISGIKMTKNLHAIILSNSSNNNIIGNNITSNYHQGVWLRDYSSQNSIHGNIIANNEYAVIFEIYSNNNSITENYIRRNQGGILLLKASQNRITANNVTSNTDGIWLLDSSDNLVFHNNFINNTVQAYTANSWNVWDDGVEGNYWSDLAFVDADDNGIADTSYIIGDDNQDRYPVTSSYLIPGFWHDQPRYKLTITSTKGGTTDPIPGTHSYMEGSSINVTAIPISGHTFDHWQFDGEERKENPITILIETNYNLEAFFLEYEQTCSIRIQVNDVEDNPIDGASVSSSSKPGEQPFLSDTTGSDGSVIFKDVKLGNYQFQASKSGYVTKTDSVSITEEEAELTIYLEEEVKDRWVIPGFPYQSILPGLALGALMLWLLLRRK